MEWNTRESLALVTAVARLGEQAWPAVSRLVRSTCGHRRNLSQQMCARQYDHLLEQYKADISREEPAALALCRRFTYRHLGELRREIMEERKRYFYLAKQAALIDEMDGEQLEELYEELTNTPSLDDGHKNTWTIKDDFQIAEALQFILNRAEAFSCQYSSPSSSISTMGVEDEDSAVSDDEQEDVSGVDDCSSKPVSTAIDVDDSCTVSRMTKSLSSEHDIGPGQLRRSARLASSQRERERDRQNQVRKEITRLWKRVWLMPEASPFLRPLPTAVMKKSLYGKLVKKRVLLCYCTLQSLFLFRPIDLSTIKKQIKSGELQSILELRREMLQMLTNALIYHRTRVARKSKEMVFCPDLKEKAMAILRVLNSNCRANNSTNADSQDGIGRRRSMRSPKRVSSEGYLSKKAKQ